MRKNKRAQVTLFIIIGIILVSVAVGIFIFRDRLFTGDIPASLSPVHALFLSCLEEDIGTGVEILESQGGYIDIPDFESGSRYMPFSSHLSFLGNPVPYWYYVSGNNVQKEQVPSRSGMEEELGDYLEEQIVNCIFDEYYSQGVEISMSPADASADVTIREREIEVNLNMVLSLAKGEDSVIVSSHRVVAKSNLGKLYDAAREVYDYEQDTLFLENYGVDTLRLYAPVDGVELGCSPVTWNADEIFDELESAIELNTIALRSEGSDYTLRRPENEYFVVNIPGVPGDVDVRFMNSRNWPHGFEVNPSSGPMLIAKPVGTQPGVAIMGFCYVPYHFVYNVRYPVLVQTYMEDEIFQFPIAIVLQGNKPRESVEGAKAVDVRLPEICEYRNTPTTVRTYDSRLNPIEADISYQCFGTVCDIGRTRLTDDLVEDFPQCVNGYILARAEGYRDKKYTYSSTEEDIAEIIMDKMYELDIDLELGGRSYDGEAMVSFVRDEGSVTVLWPETKTIELSEGQYKIEVYIYRESSLKLEETTYSQCVDVPRGGVGGIFGLTDEECFETTIPAQDVESALAGGGRENYYVLESELVGASTIRIDASSLPLPRTLEDLQINYILFEEKNLVVNIS